MKRNNLIFIFIGAIIIVAAAIGIFCFRDAIAKSNDAKRPRYPRNFQLTEEQINEVNSFFTSSPTSEQINSYCSQNREYCFYYCRNTDESNEPCKQIMNFTRPVNFTRDNFSHGGPQWNQ